MLDDKCTICSKWPPGLRSIMRLAITKLPSPPRREFSLDEVVRKVGAH